MHTEYRTGGGFRSIDESIASIDRVTRCAIVRPLRRLQLVNLGGIYTVADVERFCDSPSGCMMNSIAGVAMFQIVHLRFISGAASEPLIVTHIKVRCYHFL